jgi:hypothetical protein
MRIEKKEKILPFLFEKAYEETNVDRKKSLFPVYIDYLP